MASIWAGVKRGPLQPAAGHHQQLHAEKGQVTQREADAQNDENGRRGQG